MNVAVTGMGYVGAFGAGREALAAGLAAGNARVLDVDRSGGWHRPGASRAAALVPQTDLSTWVAPAAARRMSRPSKLAVAAAQMALADAGMTDGQASAGTIAVDLATAFGPASFTERLVAEILANPETASPFLFTECVANAPAAEVALAVKARGPNVTITQREAGPLVAFARAAADVRERRADLALAGAVEEMTPLLHAVLGRFGALARPRGGGETARPFDRRRDGFLAAEGSGVVVLESEPNARRRGARVLARVSAWGGAFDPTATPGTWGHGHDVLAASLRASLDRAGIPLGSIDRIVSGASGSRDGDRLEGRWLRAAWGAEPLPSVLVPKGVTGEYAGGHLLAAVLVAAGAASIPSSGFRESDDACGVVPHGVSPLPPARCVLATSTAAGGAAAWVVLAAS